MTVKEYAKDKGVSVQSVYDKLKRGTLSFHNIDGVKNIVDKDSPLTALNDVVSTVDSDFNKELTKTLKTLDKARRKHLKVKHKLEIESVKLKSMEQLLHSREEEIVTLKKTLDMISGLVSKKLLEIPEQEEDVIDLVPSKKKRKKKK